MTTSKIHDDRIKGVSFDASSMTVALMDGRCISTPLAWYPRLHGATRAQLEQWEIIGDGQGLHWEQFDEDLSVEGMLRGFPAAGYRADIKG
jgi:hypothetical protein